jgi:hypothetical protein
MYTTLLWLNHFMYLWLKTYAGCENYVLPISIFASHWLKFTICISTGRCYCICISSGRCYCMNWRYFVGLCEIELMVSWRFVQNWVDGNLFACVKLNWRYLVACVKLHGRYIVGLCKIGLTVFCWLVWNWIVGIISACVKLNLR